MVRFAVLFTILLLSGSSISQTYYKAGDMNGDSIRFIYFNDPNVLPQLEIGISPFGPGFGPYGDFIGFKLSGIYRINTNVVLRGNFFGDYAHLSLFDSRVAVEHPIKSWIKDKRSGIVLKAENNTIWTTIVPGTKRKFIAADIGAVYSGFINRIDFEETIGSVEYDYYTNSKPAFGATVGLSFQSTKSHQVISEELDKVLTIHNTSRLYFNVSYGRIGNYDLYERSDFAGDYILSTKQFDIDNNAFYWRFGWQGHYGIRYLPLGGIVGFELGTMPAQTLTLNGESFGASIAFFQFTAGIALGENPWKARQRK